MRQTQVDGETYVNTADVADWIVLHNEDLAHLGGPWPTVAKALSDLAESLRHWGCGSERKELDTGEVDDDEDICGFCGEPGADKFPHPVRWPGEESAGTELVHADCESDECSRAHAALSDDERRRFLETYYPVEVFHLT